MKENHSPKREREYSPRGSPRKGWCEYTFSNGLDNHNSRTAFVLFLLLMTTISRNSAQCAENAPPPFQPTVVGTADMDGNVCETSVFLILLKALQNRWSLPKTSLLSFVLAVQRVTVVDFCLLAFGQCAGDAAVQLCHVGRCWGGRLGRWWSFLLGPVPAHEGIRRGHWLFCVFFFLYACLERVCSQTQLCQLRCFNDYTRQLHVSAPTGHLKVVFKRT